MTVNFNDLNAVSNSVALECCYYESKFEIVCDDEVMRKVNFLALPNGLKLKNEIYHQHSYNCLIVGVISPLESWTEISLYESEKVRYKRDDELVGGQISHFDNSPLTYGYIRKMLRVNPGWIHYSGFNYHNFGKVAFYKEQGDYKAPIVVDIQFSKNCDKKCDVDKFSTFQSILRIHPNFDANDFLEKYKKSNGE